MRNMQDSTAKSNPYNAPVPTRLRIIKLLIDL